MPCFSLCPGACAHHMSLPPGSVSLPDSSDSELELSTVRHQPEGLDQLQAQTKFTKKELQSLYRGFKNVSAPCVPLRGPQSLATQSHPSRRDTGPGSLLETSADHRNTTRASGARGCGLLLRAGRPQSRRCEGHCAPQRNTWSSLA